MVTIEQAIFRKDYSISEYLLLIRVLMENSVEYNFQLWIVLIIHFSSQTKPVKIKIRQAETLSPKLYNRCIRYCLTNTLGS